MLGKIVNEVKFPTANTTGSPFLMSIQHLGKSNYTTYFMNTVI